MAKRPNILKLATKISLESLTYTGITYTDPEYRILDPIVTDDMCRVMMHLGEEAGGKGGKAEGGEGSAQGGAAEQVVGAGGVGRLKGGRRRLLLLSYLGPRHHGGHSLQP